MILPGPPGLDKPGVPARVGYYLVERKLRCLRNWRLAVFACLVLLSAGVRFVNLDQMAPFVDEDGYSTFAQSLYRLTWRQVVLHPDMLAPLTGDKPPLAIILQAWLNSSVHDLVLSGRVLSAVAGTATTVLCFWLGRKLGGNNDDIGLVSMAAYAGLPLSVLHERMVLQDPLMSAFSLAAVLAAWTAIEHGSVRLAGLSAGLGAIAVQFKISGLVTAPLILAAIVAVDSAHRKYWYLAAIGAAGVLLSYVLLIIGPAGASLQDQNQKLLGPLAYVGANLDVLRDTVATYFPWGLPVIGLVGAAAALRLNPGRGFIYVLGVCLWVAPWVVVSRFAPSRYYVPANPYACALIGFGAVWMVAEARKLGGVFRTVSAGILTVVLGASGVTSLHLSTDVLTAPLSTLDDCQYRPCWPSGYPYRAARDFVNTALPADSSVEYMVDEEHRIALGLERPPPAGIRSLGIVKRGSVVAVDSVQPLYVVVDDVRDTESGTGLRALLTEYPRFTLVAQFLRPGSTGGVSIVRAS